MDLCPTCPLVVENQRLRDLLTTRQLDALRQGDRVMAHTGDPWTSHAAAALLSGPRRWESRIRVLARLVLGTEQNYPYEHPKIGPALTRSGLTDDELCFLPDPQGLGLSRQEAYSTWRTCRTELYHLGVVVPTNLVRPSWSESNRDMMAIVWAAIPDALTEFTRLRELSIAINAADG